MYKLSYFSGWIAVGEDRRIGLINGREANRVVDGEFAVGLTVSDYENGTIEWVSEDPFVSDPGAESITFASGFRQIDADRA